MRSHQLQQPYKRRPRKRVGRGSGSGQGTYAGRGTKGQKARSGGGVRPAFEGGQLPMVKSLPTLRGFTNIFRKRYQEVNVGQLARFTEGAHVTPEALREQNLVKHARFPVKVLGKGELDRSLTVSAHKFSQSARQKIQTAGGTVQEL